MRQRKWVGDNVKLNIKLFKMRKFIIVVILFSCSCNKSYKHNDPIDLAKYVIYSLKNDDSLGLKKHFLNKKYDSIYLDSMSYYRIQNTYSNLSDKDSEFIEKYELLKSFNKIEGLNYIDVGLNQFETQFEEGKKFLNKYIQNNDLKNIRYYYHFDKLTYNAKDLFVYFQSNDSINYLLYFGNVYSINDTLKFTHFKFLNKDECSSYFFSDDNHYDYFGIKNDKINYQYQRNKKDEFSSFYFNLSNESDYNFDKIKLQISFYNPINNEVYLSKTISKSVDLKSKDKILFTLDEICGIPLGFSIEDKDKFSYKIKILEMSPFPYSNEFK